jgi:hypothetical protein
MDGDGLPAAQPVDHDLHRDQVDIDHADDASVPRAMGAAARIGESADDA